MKLTLQNGVEGSAQAELLLISQKLGDTVAWKHFRQSAWLAKAVYRDIDREDPPKARLEREPLEDSASFLADVDAAVLQHETSSATKLRPSGGDYAVEAGGSGLHGGDRGPPQPGKSEASSSGSDGTDNADASMSKDLLRETAAKLERDC